MHVMGGFEKQEAYYVPRVVLKIPYSREQLCSKLLPDWEKWKDQVNSPLGDSHGDLLVNELLPFLLQVAVQDGIYWLVDFPNHPCTNILKQSLRDPMPYERWALIARRECEALRTSQPESQYEALSDAVVLSNNTFARRQDQHQSVLTGILHGSENRINQIHREQRELFQKVYHMSNRVDNGFNNIYSLLQQGKY